MIKIVRIEQTCNACPSQWDAWDDKGKYYYIRYRYDIFRVERNNVVISVVIYKHIKNGHGWDGSMTTSEMMELTSYMFDWSELE